MFCLIIFKQEMGTETLEYLWSILWDLRSQIETVTIDIFTDKSMKTGQGKNYSEMSQVSKMLFVVTRPQDYIVQL